MTTKGFVTFLFGAFVGAAATAFFTPTTGEELRKRVREKVKSMTAAEVDDVDQLVEMIAAEIEKK